MIATFVLFLLEGVQRSNREIEYLNTDLATKWRTDWESFTFSQRKRERL